VCSAIPSKGRQIAKLRLAMVIAAWREFFEISQMLHTERISPLQVTDENGRAGCALIGVTFDSVSATIYHTRALTTEDLIHELLHVAHPHWSEANVVHETERLWRPGVVLPGQTLASRADESMAA
jgi:hypothetical protein